MSTSPSQATIQSTWLISPAEAACDAAALPATRGRIRRVCNIALVVLFAAGIFVPLAGQLTGLSQPVTVLAENRQPAAFPTFKFRHYGPIPWPRKHSLVQFPEKFEAWYNDHLGFRRELVQCYNLARLHGVAPEALTSPGIGGKQGSPVVVGRNGWLYYNRQQSIETYRATDLFSESDLDEWEALIRRRHDWLEERGIRYLLVFAPEKPTIYPEFLPRALNRAAEVSRLDQLLERLRRTSPEINVVDLRQSLIEAKNQHPTYFRTDTHWNNFGALVGYREIVRGIERWFADAQPWDVSDFEISSYDCDGQDLAKMLDSLVPLSDTYLDVRPLRPPSAFHMRLPTEEGSRECVRSMHTTAPLGRAMVLHDSFFVAVMPFLNEHFRQIDYCWMYEFPCEAIERERPQVLVQEMVERCLMIYKPENARELTGTKRETASEVTAQ